MTDRPNSEFHQINFRTLDRYQEFKALARERGISFQDLMHDLVLIPALSRLHNDFGQMSLTQLKRELSRLKLEREDHSQTLEEINAEIDNCSDWIKERESKNE